MKYKIGFLVAVLISGVISTSAFAQESFLDKVQKTINQTEIEKGYKSLIGNSEGLVKDLEKQIKNMDIVEIEKTLGSTEWLNGKNSKIIKAMVEKQLPGVIEEIKAQLEKAPNNTKLLIKLAVAYQFGAKYSLAITVAEKILTLEPGNYNAAMIKAQCYKLMGETEKGAAYLEKFMKAQLSNPDLAQMLASMKMDMGQEEKAIKELESSIGKFPNGKKLYEELAKDYEKIGEKGIKFFVDGKKVDFSKYGKIEPVVRNGSTMVPIRVVADCLNIGISYIPKTGTVTLINKGKTIVLKENEKTAKVNKKVIKIDAAAQNIKGRIMVPLRFVSEQFSKDVKWFPFNKYGIISLN